jgi:GTPase involved in cell partitioning and DNA repair
MSRELERAHRFHAMARNLQSMADSHLHSVKRGEELQHINDILKANLASIKKELESVREQSLKLQQELNRKNDTLIIHRSDLISIEFKYEVLETEVEGTPFPKSYRRIRKIK